jgi:hypothetical protein
MCIECVVEGDVLREINHMEDQGAEGRIILKRNFMKWNGAWTGLMWLRIGAIGVV